MNIKETLETRISKERAKELLIELVKVPSPQTDNFEAEPLLAEFIRTAVEPRLRGMGITDIHYDGMNNLIATHGADQSGKSLMFISNAMNQPQSTMKNAYLGDVVDGAALDLPGEVVLGKGASEQKANMASMLHAMETVIASDLPVNGRLVFLCCVSGETGRHDAIKSVVEGEGVTADMAILGGTSLKLTLGNRGRIDKLHQGQGQSRPFKRAAPQLQRHHRRARGYPPARGPAGTDRRTSGAGQADLRRQPYQKRPRRDPYHPGRMFHHTRPPPAAGRRPGGKNGRT